MNGNLTLNKPFISNYIDISASIFENQFLGSVFGYQGIVCKNGFYVKSGPGTSGVTTYALIDSIGTISTTSTIDAIGLITSDTGFSIPTILTINNNGTINQTSTGLNNLFNSSFSGTSNQIEIKNTSNVGPSTISQSGSSLNISSVSNNVSPQTTMVLSTRNTTNGGCVLFNGNSTILNIGTNTATTNITSTSIANIQSPTLNITSTTSNIDSTNININGITNFKNNVNISLYNFDITNTLQNQGMRIFNNGSNNGITDFHGIGTTTRFNFYSTSGYGLEVNNSWIGNGNNAVIQGQAGKGIEMTSDNIVIQGITNFNNTTTPTIKNIISLGDNTQKIATTAFVKGQSYATTTNLNNYALLTTPSQTLTGINTFTGVVPSTPIVIKNTVSSNSGGLLISGPGSYNGINNANDFSVVAFGPTVETGVLTLTTWSTGYCGIKIDNATIKYNAPFSCWYYTLATVPFLNVYDIGHNWLIAGATFANWTTFTTTGNIATIVFDGIGSRKLGVWQVDIVLCTENLGAPNSKLIWTTVSSTSSDLTQYCTYESTTALFGSISVQIMRLSFILKVNTIPSTYYLNYVRTAGAGSALVENKANSKIEFTRIA